MEVEKSCPVLVIHEDDAFRKSLIAALDRKHFTVTFSEDGKGAVGLLRDRSFHIVLVGLDLKTRSGLEAVDYIGSNRDKLGKGVIIVADPSPEVRAYARHANETLMKPVDPEYVADRARTYCTT